MNSYLNVSTSPHTRSRLSTGNVMRDVCIALLPATAVGVWHFGLKALITIVAAIAAAVLSELLFDLIAKRGPTWKDGSAVVTGLLLALCLSPTVPVYIPVLGSVFAILFVKCFFGGLGKNFMNPALAGRCFLLISFSSTMTNYRYSDAVSSATPLVDLLGGRTINLTQLFLGNGTATGVIGCSALALLIGGLYLLLIDAITWEIPVSCILGFSLFVAMFDPRGGDLMYVLAHLCGGGILMGAFFMATDPVTSPMTTKGQLLYGALIGILAGVFRVYATAADSVSYAIIICNLLTPLIDEYIVPRPFGLRSDARGDGHETQFLTPRRFLPAVTLCIITLAAGAGLAGVYNMTKGVIEEKKVAAQRASYLAVLPGAVDLAEHEGLAAAVSEAAGAVYGTEFGRVFINDAVAGVNDAGETVGYVANVTSADGFDGNITLSVGVDADGVVQAIEFTELNETAGMGMRCAEPEFKDQFSGKQVEAFVLNKAGGSTGDDEIDTVSGASISSGAVVNAVNAALAFLRSSVG